MVRPVTEAAADILEEGGSGLGPHTRTRCCLCFTIFHLFSSLFLTPPVSFLVFSP